jgi:hypothetical protein
MHHFSRDHSYNNDLFNAHGTEDSFAVDDALLHISVASPSSFLCIVFMMPSP